MQQMCVTSAGVQYCHWLPAIARSFKTLPVIFVSLFLFGISEINCHIKTILLMSSTLFSFIGKLRLSLIYSIHAKKSHAVLEINIP